MQNLEERIVAAGKLYHTTREYFGEDQDAVDCFGIVKGFSDDFEKVG